MGETTNLNWLYRRISEPSTVSHFGWSFSLGNGQARVRQADFGCWLQGCGC